MLVVVSADYGWESQSDSCYNNIIRTHALVRAHTHQLVHVHICQAKLARKSVYSAYMIR